MLILCVLSTACAGHELQTSSATAGAAVVRNSIHVGLIETAFFVVDSIDGVKVHEKLDFKRHVEVAAGERTLTVMHYTDALWGSREGSETCTIVVEVEPEGSYKLEGAAERSEWRARLVNRRNGQELRCLFPDETGFGAARAGEKEQVAPISPPPAAELGSDPVKPNAEADVEERDDGAAQDVAAEAVNQPRRRRSFCPRGFYRVGFLEGDSTFVLERSDRVRLIGIRPAALNATQLGASAMSIEGKCVRFDYEPASLIDGHRDRDGRLLAYVYLEDGTFVNLELIREGRARASEERHRHLAEFLAAQSVARKAGIGVWRNGN
jgi:endonuclease YncB( thermonuclease family)